MKKNFDLLRNVAEESPILVKIKGELYEYCRLVLKKVVINKIVIPQMENRSIATLKSTEVVPADKSVTLTFQDNSSFTYVALKFKRWNAVYMGGHFIGIFNHLGELYD